MKRLSKGLFFWAYGASTAISYAISHLSSHVLASRIEH